MADCKQTETKQLIFFLSCQEDCPSQLEDSQSLSLLKGPILLRVEVAVAQEARTDVQITSPTSPRTLCTTKA